MARFQDANSPIKTLAVFHNGRLVAKVDQATDPWGTELRNAMDGDYPGCEVLACCNTHPDTAAVDCLVCWPLDTEDVAR